MGVYATVAEVKAEPEVPDGAADADVEARIATAEDLIDMWLGLWDVAVDGPSTGRKIVEAEVEPWRWAKLKRATIRLAAQLYGRPLLLEPGAGKRVKGPDFEVEEPTAGVAKIADVTAALNASGLRRMAARAVP